MQNDFKAILLDLKARQESGQHMTCPRCGRDTMKEPIHTNALSRSADLYVCDECGTCEALLAFMKNPMQLEDWACFKPKCPPSDLETLALNQAIQQLDEIQIPYLSELFARWLDDKTCTDFEAYRREATENCPGIQELWPDPFRAIFFSRHFRIHVRFKRVNDRVEVAIDSTKR